MNIDKNYDVGGSKVSLLLDSNLADFIDVMLTKGCRLDYPSPYNKAPSMYGDGCAVLSFIPFITGLNAKKYGDGVGTGISLKEDNNLTEENMYVGHSYKDAFKKVISGKQDRDYFTGMFDKEVIRESFRMLDVHFGKNSPKRPISEFAEISGRPLFECFRNLMLSCETLGEDPQINPRFYSKDDSSAFIGEAHSVVSSSAYYCVKTAPTQSMGM